MVSFYDFQTARDIVTINEANHLVKIYRNNGLGSDMLGSCCLFDTFRCQIDFQLAREMQGQQLTFDQEPERLGYEDDDIEQAFKGSVQETRGWRKDKQQGFAIKLTDVWSVYVLESESGSIRPIGR